MAAIIIGAIASGVALVAARFAFTTLRSPFVRTVIASVFAIPVALAGYHAALGLAHIGAATNGWQQAIAVIGAVIVGATAWSSMTLSTSHEPGQGIAAGLTPSVPLASAPNTAEPTVRRWPLELPSRSLITAHDHGTAVAELRSNPKRASQARAIRACDAGTARVAGTCSANPFVRWDFFSFAARGCRLVQVFDIGHVISPVLLERAGDAGL